MKKDSIRALYVMPGPIFDVSTQLGKKFVALSAFSHGTIVSTAPHNTKLKAGKFDVVLFRFGRRVPVLGVVALVVRCYLEARKLAAAGGIDVIVCYDPLKSGVIGILIKRIFGGKLIVEINGIYDSPILYEQRGFGGKIRQFIFPRVEQFIINRCDAIKCLFDRQLSNFKIPEKTWVHTFFDHTDIAVSGYTCNLDNVVLSIGFPAYIKGMDILIEGFKRASGEVPGWKLVLVGDYSDVERKELRHRICGEQSIEVRRPVPFEDIPALIDTCNIFVLGSRSEGMGRVLVEAMARSKPRIAANVGGIPSIVNHEIDGLLFEFGDIEALSVALVKLMKAEPLRRRLANAARKRFVRDFTIDVYSSKVQQQYLDVLNGTRP